MTVHPPALPVDAPPQGLRPLPPLILEGAPEITLADLERIESEQAARYSDTSPHFAVVADGWAVKIFTERGHLVIRDGETAHPRVRRLTRSQRTVRRVLVLGSTGMVTLAAMQWCVDAGVALVNVTNGGAILAATLSAGPNESRLRRAQASAPTSSVGVEVARYLINTKIRGHGRNLQRLAPDDTTTRGDLERFADRVINASGLDAIRESEAQAAARYFASWSRNVHATFTPSDSPRMPEHWTQGNPRRSRLHPVGGRSPRKATDPVNAMLNYAFALAEVECRIAAHSVGLDPALGIVHNDTRGRDSLALDLLETIRPSVEATILDLLAVRRFRHFDFVEMRDGTCRLTESVTHTLATAMPVWAAEVAPIAEHVAHAIAATSPTRIRARTPLTRDRNRAAQAVHSLPAVVALPSAGIDAASPRTVPAVATAFLPSCLDCGRILRERRRKRCGPCNEAHRITLATERVRRAAEARLSAAVDPAQTLASREARMAGQRAAWAARRKWNEDRPPGEIWDTDAFRRDVLPRLAGMPLSRIVEACGVSLSAATRWRSGSLTPSPRHWASLASLTDGPTSDRG